MSTAQTSIATSEADFNRLLQAERRRLYGIAYSILRDHSEAEDALQGAMLRAWTNWDRVEIEGARPAWLVKVTVNHCMNHRKSLLRHRSNRTTQPNDAAPQDPRFAGRLLDLDRGYRRLSKQQRAAMFLHYHYGYSIDECAGLMGCGAGSIRTHLARAFASLRKEMVS